MAATSERLGVVKSANAAYVNLLVAPAFVLALPFVLELPLPPAFALPLPFVLELPLPFAPAFVLELIVGSGGGGGGGVRKLTPLFLFLLGCGGPNILWINSDAGSSLTTNGRCLLLFLP